MIIFSAVVALVMGGLLVVAAGLLYAGIVRNQSPTFHRETKASRVVGSIGVVLLIVAVTVAIVASIPGAST